MKIAASILFCVISVSVFCQTADRYLISTTGGYFNNENLQLDFAVGEIVTESFSTENLFLTQGFIQPEIFIVSIQPTNRKNFFLNVYPNPAKNFFIADIKSEKQIGQYKWSNLTVFDINGETVLKQVLYKNNIKIDISKYHAGPYFVQIINDKEVESAILIKTD